MRIILALALAATVCGSEGCGGEYYIELGSENAMPPNPHQQQPGEPVLLKGNVGGEYRVIWAPGSAGEGLGGLGPGLGRQGGQQVVAECRYEDGFDRATTIYLSPATSLFTNGGSATATPLTIRARAKIEYGNSRSNAIEMWVDVGYGTLVTLAGNYFRVTVYNNYFAFALPLAGGVIMADFSLNASVNTGGGEGYSPRVTYYPDGVLHPAAPKTFYVPPFARKLYMEAPIGAKLKLSFFARPQSTPVPCGEYSFTAPDTFVMGGGLLLPGDAFSVEVLNTDAVDLTYVRLMWELFN